MECIDTLAYKIRVLGGELCGILALTSEQVRVVDGKGEIDPIPPISISPSDIKQLDFYRTKRTDPDIIVIQLKQNSAPH
jgi:hypothetical protein